MESERVSRARSFGGVAGAYERGRPEYPPEAVRWLVQGAREVVDLGAGTGKLTRGLARLRVDVVAVEPSREMAAQLREAVPGARVVAGSAEALPLPDASADAVVAGQAYHWFDPARALPEIARVLRPDGALGLVWNMRDERVPWVARLTKLLGGPEERHGRPVDSLAGSGLFGAVEEARFEHAQRLDRQALLDLSLSRSSVAVLDERGRADVLAGVGRLYDEAADADGIDLPYITACFRATRL